MSKNIVVTEKADNEKNLKMCWQCNSEQEAVDMIEWLACNGIKAKAVNLIYCKDFK